LLKFAAELNYSKPYGDAIAETRSLHDDYVVAELDRSLVPTSSGRRWLHARRPALYGLLTASTGQELPTRTV
jgi:hypothetical protein